MSHVTARQMLNIVATAERSSESSKKGSIFVRKIRVQKPDDSLLPKPQFLQMSLWADTMAWLDTPTKTSLLAGLQPQHLEFGLASEKRQ